MKISILGYGTFGKAIANYLTKRGHIVYAEEIKEDTEIIFVTVPSYAVSKVLNEFKGQIQNQKIIICSKGFAQNGQLLSQVLEKDFPQNEFLFMFGPTLAEELEEGLFTSVVLASRGQSKEELKRELESDIFYVELSDDIIGVQVSGALKNVVTIFVGLIEGAKLGQNLRAFVFTKGILAIMRVGLKLGAKQETFTGLACLGDLTLDSRNRNLGVLLGRGHKVTEFKQEIGSPQEGLATLEMIKEITDDKYFEVLYDIIFKELPIKDGIKKIIN